MNESELEKAALWLAEHTPILRDPVSPPIRWVMEGDILRVLMADGRTFRKPLADIKAALQAEKQAAKAHPAVVEVIEDRDQRSSPVDTANGEPWNPLPAKKRK